ncbi:MAG: hypothetical protein ACYTBJ_26280 [Planctomycetota bacterium]|jgi:hypothetical protein
MSTQNRLKVTKTLEGPIGGCINLSADYLRHILIENFGTTETGVTGAQQVTNGNFSADTDWTKGTGWTIASNKATKTAGTASTLEQANADIEVGESYYVTVRLSGVTAGSVTPYVGNTGTGTARSSDGFYDETIVAAGTLVQGLSADSSFAGSCEVVSIRKVETVALTDKMLRAVTRENQIVQPASLGTTPWVFGGLSSVQSTGGGVDLYGKNFQGFVGDTGTGAHLNSQVVNIGDTDLRTLIVFAKAGDLDWARIGVVSPTAVTTAVKHDIVNDTAGATTGTPIARHAIKLLNGDFLIAMSFVPEVGNNTIRLFPAETDVNNNYTGDGATVNTWFSSVHMVTGKLEEHIAFADGGASAFPRQLTFEIAGSGDAIPIGEW